MSVLTAPLGNWRPAAGHLGRTPAMLAAMPRWWFLIAIVLAPAWACGPARVDKPARPAASSAGSTPRPDSLRSKTAMGSDKAVAAKPSGDAERPGAVDDGTPPPADAGDATNSGPDPTTVTDLTGAFGFNWFQETSACVPIAAAKLARLHEGKTSCTLNDGPPFGGAEPEFAETVSFTCTVDKRTEWLIFSSKPACQDQLETMRANAP